MGWKCSLAKVSSSYVHDISTLNIDVISNKIRLQQCYLNKMIQGESFALVTWSDHRRNSFIAIVFPLEIGNFLGFTKCTHRWKSL